MVISISRPKFEEILNYFNINILQKGSQFFISCPDPQHEDKNPSCQLNLGNFKETFFCYTCGAKRDVFDLISFVENKDLKKVLKKFSPSKNISFREVSSFSEKTKKEESPSVRAEGLKQGSTSKKDLTKNSFSINYTKNKATSLPSFFQELSREELVKFHNRRLKYLAQNFIKGYHYAEKLTDYNLKEIYPFFSCAHLPLGIMLRLESHEGKKLSFKKTTNSIRRLSFYKNNLLT